MNIFESKEDFASKLRAFVLSQHCSKIELSMLVDLINKKSKEFQIGNQQVIGVVIEGFCSRIQLQDIDDANHFRDRIKDIQLEDELLMKVDKIDKIKLCLRIFDAFCMEDITLQVLLSDTLHIIEIMMEKFFNGDIKNTHVTIEKKQKSKSNHIF